MLNKPTKFIEKRIADEIALVIKILLVKILSSETKTNQLEVIPIASRAEIKKISFENICLNNNIR